MRASHQSTFKTALKAKSFLFFAAVTLISANIPCYGQLPNTNFGQFVHQPGDNQYTNQIQAERHGSPAPVSVPMQNVMPSGAPAASSTTYRPTPAAPKPDISLLPVVADEPIRPAGFPPLPDRLDLPATSAGVWTSANSQASAGGAGGGGNNGIAQPQGVHEHYVHYQAGAFMPSQPAQQTSYNPSNSASSPGPEAQHQYYSHAQAGAFMPTQSAQQNYKPSNADYYNVNPGAKNGMASAAPIETPSEQALKKIGTDPQLAADKATKPDAPTAVTVNQSVSQDLSLPEDDFNKHYPTNINNTTANRTANGAGRMLTYPLATLGYSIAGMGMGAASMAGMYALHR